jgi:hypothetical protein
MRNEIVVEKKYVRLIIPSMHFCNDRKQLMKTEVYNATEVNIHFLSPTITKATNSLTLWQQNLKVQQS